MAMRCDALHRHTVTRFTMEAPFKHKVPRLAMSALKSALLVLSAPLLRKVAVSLLVRVRMLTNYLKLPQAGYVASSGNTWSGDGRCRRMRPSGSIISSPQLPNIIIARYCVQMAPVSTWMTHYIAQSTTRLTDMDEQREDSRLRSHGLCFITFYRLPGCPHAEFCNIKHLART